MVATKLKRVFIAAALLLSLPVYSQFMDSQTGLLQMPSGEMQEDGTFMITNNFVNEHSLPQENVWWGYNSFMYGINITFLSRIEISYICVLFRGQAGPGLWPEETWGKYTNQDRHFAVRLQLLKEGEFGWDWLPSLVIGASDPYTLGYVSPADIAARSGNGVFNRTYLCASKHFRTAIGEVGVHVGYQYNQRTDYHYNAPCAGVTWRPVWTEDNRWFNPRVILEFDSRTVNIGFISSIWDGRFEAMFELQNLRWINFGLRYKLRLKKATD